MQYTIENRVRYLELTMEHIRKLHPGLFEGLPDPGNIPEPAPVNAKSKDREKGDK